MRGLIGTDHFAQAVAHYTVAFEENEHGWWIPRCSCGAKGDAYPTAEDACDALMEHAYECGYADASMKSNPTLRRQDA